MCRIIRARETEREENNHLMHVYKTLNFGHLTKSGPGPL